MTRDRIGLDLCALLVVLLSVACSAPQAQPRQQPAATAAAQVKPLDPEAVRRLFAAYQEASQALFFSTSQPCTTNPCEVWIDLYTTQFQGKDWCIARLPEELTFPGAAQGNPPKGIRWILRTGTLLGRTVEFHQAAGILKVDDGKTQFHPDAQRTTPIVFEGTNKHNKNSATATYVPVIIFYTTGGIPELCAAGDPKIVNP